MRHEPQEEAQGGAGNSARLDRPADSTSPLGRVVLPLLATLAALAAVGVTLFGLPNPHAQGMAAPPVPAAIPVAVATVESRDVTLWSEFSGRLEAVDRVEIRSRVAGAIQAVHFREGDLVSRGDLLISIDPAPYRAAVDRADAQLAAARARLAYARVEQKRSHRLLAEEAIAQREFDERANNEREAEANLRAAEASLRTARLDLSYSSVQAPVSGRVGRLEVTVGNLVAAGPGAPVLTTLVSVDPIYASFEADEQEVSRALADLRASRKAEASANAVEAATIGETAKTGEAAKAAEPLKAAQQIKAGESPAARRYSDELARIAVRMETLGQVDPSHIGRLQLIDNRVDASSGTVRVRAVFDNTEGALIPGQFARIRMAQPRSEATVLINQRAIGTDQSKRFVFVIDEDNKVAWREVVLGPTVDGLRVVSKGLQPGERIVVNGLQHVRPGAVVAPQPVAMSGWKSP